MSKKSRQKQRVWLIIAFIIVGYFASKFSPEQAYSTSSSQATIEQLLQQKKSDVQVEVTGRVVKILPDDLEGRRHQKFIISHSSGATLLIAHNIDLAHRIDDLQQGDDVTVYGEYEWNAKGGIIHWTHHDPAGKHPNGWIRHRNKQYQ